MRVETVNPPGFVRPVGYAHMTRISGGEAAILLLGGVTGMDQSGAITCPGDIVGQMDRALANIKAALAHVGGRPDHLVRMRIFTTDMEAYRSHLQEIGRVWRSHFGRHYPAMALLGVAGLFDPQALVEIETEAVVPGE